ncbi:site-2 protease family protein [Fulvivirga sedimenti]|uniref:Site-2 protease family protein n=1 Tax=Fulvivirga sedimenti TaxID=2879465 RepID=A0A9X1HRI2_9BACT|nr:site-2 protease family protein [Fulvivirga sedimenti]MCA6074887.1 site-2 protease family protein [Fulvivirga sedimenti]MCA6076064.1 site-2 protease family protein [Fulvivirga sedimenti]MCA6077192.1 site-2 protease family protein [Fulvivirga sedimenti]
MKGIKRIYIIQLVLFLTTFVTVTLSGEYWMRGKLPGFTEFTWKDFQEGLLFTLPFLGFLTVHEFGHYFTARKHNVDTTLPYYIPLPPFFLVGTLGAIIRIREKIQSKKKYFDIGIAGPLAGFVIAVLSLAYGFTHLPDQSYLYEIHPEYAESGIQEGAAMADSDSVINLAIGKNLLYLAMEKTLPGTDDFIPPANEIIHYPFLFAGFLALFFTALNLLPIGQLDGGHVLYGLIGWKPHSYVARIIFSAFLFYAGLGLFTPNDTQEELLWAPLYVGFLYYVLRSFKKPPQTTLMYALIMFTAQFLIPMIYPELVGYSGWLLFAFMISRLIGIEHPRATDEEPLNRTRQILGWIALLIFVISFSPAPFIIG